MQLHDGSWITLRALAHDELDVRDRASAAFIFFMVLTSGSNPTATSASPKDAQ